MSKTRIQVTNEPPPKIDPRKMKPVDPNKLARALEDPRRQRVPGTEVKLQRYGKDQS